MALYDAESIERNDAARCTPNGIDPDEGAGQVICLKPFSYLYREGHQTETCMILLDGLAQRHKIVARGARQIVGLCVAGDLLDPQLLYMVRLDHCIQALTECRVLLVSQGWLNDMAAANAAVRRALWASMVIETAISREWQANLGRRNAVMRLGHLLCELRYRLDSAAPVDGESIDLPLTQGQLADLLGLTAVHVNRVLREIEERGLIQRNRRHIVVPDWEKLCRAADFNPAYLHRDILAGDHQSLLSLVRPTGTLP